MAISLEDIISQASQLSVQQEQHAKRVAELRTTQGTLGRKNAESLRRAGELKAEVELKKGMAELEATQLARKGATAMGTNMADISEIITATNAQLRTDLLAYQAASLQVQEIEENSNILTNPGGWLRDLFHGDQARATRDATAKRFQDTSTMLANMYALTDANTRTQLSLAETMDADTLRKSASLSRELAEQQAIAAEIDAASYDVGGIDALRSAGAEEYNRQVGIYNMLVAEQRFEASYEMQKSQLELQIRALEREQGKDAAYQYVADNVNSALRAQGLEEIPLGVVREFYGSNTPEGQLMMDLNTLGQQSRSLGTAVFGASPAHALSIAQRVGGSLPKNLDPVVAETLQDTSAKVAEEIAQAKQFQTDVEVTPSGFTRKNVNDPAQYNAAFNTIFARDLAAQDARFHERPVNFEILHRETPELTGTALYKKVVEPAMVAGAQITLQDLGRLTAEAYAAGELSSEAASVNLLMYASNWYGVYNALSGRRAIRAPEVEVTPVAMPTGRMLSISNILNTAAPAANPFVISKGALGGPKEEQVQIKLTNPADITHYLQRYRTNRLAQKLKDAKVAAANTGE